MRAGTRRHRTAQGSEAPLPLRRHHGEFPAAPPQLPPATPSRATYRCPISPPRSRAPTPAAPTSAPPAAPPARPWRHEPPAPPFDRGTCTSAPSAQRRPPWGWAAAGWGAGVGGPGRDVTRRPGAPVFRRKNASCGTRSAGRTTSAGTGGMWRFYTEDSPGLKV